MPAPEATNAPEAAPAVPPAPEGTNPEKPAVAVEPVPDPLEKWIAQHGGDRKKAGDEIWATNNRAAEAAAKAAEVARENAELKARLEQSAGTNPVAPVEAPPAVPTPTPVIEPAPEQVTQWVAQQVAQDPTCIAWDNEYRANRARLNTLIDPEKPESIAAAANEVQTLKAWLRFPQVAEDDFQKSQYASQLVLAEAKYERLQIEADRLAMRNERLDSQFNQRKGEYVSRINAHYEQQRQQYQAQQELQATSTRHATELSKAWEPAVKRAVQEHKIPESLSGKFEKSLRTAAMAHLESGLKVEEIDGFMSSHAREFMETMDTFHRQQSAEYARLATQRAASPAPVPSVVPQVQQSTGDLIKDAEAHAANAWQQLGFVSR